jgi:hypothetical protein
MSPIARTIVYVSAIAGAVFIVKGIQLVYSGFSTHNWLATQATILSSRVVTQTSPSTTTNFHHAEVNYQYSVNGKVFTSNRISFGRPESDNPQSANQVSQRYAPGAVVSAYFDPNRPEEAVLENGISSGAFVPVLLGLLLILPFAILIKRRAEA